MKITMDWSKLKGHFGFRSPVKHYRKHRENIPSPSLPGEGRRIRLRKGQTDKWLSEHPKRKKVAVKANGDTKKAIRVRRVRPQRYKLDLPAYLMTYYPEWKPEHGVNLSDKPAC